MRQTDALRTPETRAGGPSTTPLICNGEKQTRNASSGSEPTARGGWHGMPPASGRGRALRRSLRGRQSKQASPQEVAVSYPGQATPASPPRGRRRNDGNVALLPCRSRAVKLTSLTSPLRRTGTIHPAHLWASPRILYNGFRKESSRATLSQPLYGVTVARPMGRQLPGPEGTRPVPTLLALHLFKGGQLCANTQLFRLAS